MNGLHETSLPALHWILAKRLRYSRSWNNVKVVTKKKTLDIFWYDSKTKVDPKGKKVFSSRTIPLSRKSLDNEIDRQILRYLKEKDG